MEPILPQEKWLEEELRRKNKESAQHINKTRATRQSRSKSEIGKVY